VESKINIDGWLAKNKMKSNVKEDDNCIMKELTLRARRLPCVFVFWLRGNIVYYYCCCLYCDVDGEL